jgi:hypothetical protein
MNFKTKKQRNRYESLVPNGIPKYIRCYDNGGATADRYTVVMTGHYRHKTGKQYWYLGMSPNPFHSQGVGTSGAADCIIDRPSYKHLGKKIKYDSLPAECKTFIMSTYLYLWDFTDDEGYTLK